MLIDPLYGSGFFLGEILTTLELPIDSDVRMQRLEKKKCGGCQKCLVACPTQAFVGPFVLDARRCISYLTIELKGSIPVDLRPLIGNRIYGCDVCQVVCPWNRADPTAHSPLWGAVPDSVSAPSLLELMQMDDAAFQARFRNSPIWRLKRGRFLRNVAVALGNSLDPLALGVLETAAKDDPEPLVREHAQWAYDRIVSNMQKSPIAKSC